MRRLFLCCLVTVTLFSLSGCSLFGQPEQATLPIDFATLMPTEWTPVGTWSSVNIDGDEDPEYLLYYTYDSGQVGAVIYDAQQNTQFVPLPTNPAQPDATPEPLPIPNQPSPFYIPYRILPNYWEGTGQGFIAAPGQSGAISAQAVNDAAAYLGVPPTETDSESEQTTDESVEAKNELVIRGGNNYVTVVWWRNPQRGYGAAQMRGFTSLSTGEDWAEWDENPQPITTTIGLDPLTDTNARSYLCRKSIFTRRLVPPEGSQSGEYRQGVTYDIQDGGIHFCDGIIPSHQFYPEGVTLAYLLLEDAGARTALVAPEFTVEQIDAEIGLEQLQNETVNDIQGYASVPQPTVQMAGSGSSASDGRSATTTTVCVELQSKTDLSARRWLLFTLRYQPPDQHLKTTDRWLVAGVASEPGPADKSTDGHCQSVIERGQPPASPTSP